VGVEHRAGRTGQPGVPATKMLITVNGQGLALHQAGADAVGAFARLAPIGAQPQPGALALIAASRATRAADGDDGITPDLTIFSAFIIRVVASAIVILGVAAGAGPLFFQSRTFWLIVGGSRCS